MIKLNFICMSVPWNDIKERGIGRNDALFPLVISSSIPDSLWYPQKQEVNSVYNCPWFILFVEIIPSCKIIFVFQGYLAALTCRLVGIFQICYNKCPRKNRWGCVACFPLLLSISSEVSTLYNCSWIEWFSQIILSCKIILFVSRLRAKKRSRKNGWGCVAHCPKPLPDLRLNSVIFPTLFKTWPSFRLAGIIIIY